jgi:ribosomal protein S18 acetylase RimI-like enzyme
MPFVCPKLAQYPHSRNEIGEVILKDGNSVSVSALIDLALWNIDTCIMTRRNRVAGFLVNPESMSHVKTRVCQYQAYSDLGKSVEIMKTILKAKTEEHRKGTPRDKDDRDALKRLLGKRKDFVELHEWWLIETYRGKGYGNTFLDFFETHMKSQGYADLVFYADHPAALAAFRRHGYTEGGYLAGPKMYVFYHSLEKSHKNKS